MSQRLKADPYDSVTGLLTHSNFLITVEEKVRQGRESSSWVNLLLIDPDGFAEINSSRGYIFGDEALRMLGEIIQETLRDSDLTCRFSGSTFASLLLESTGEQAIAAAERVREAVIRADLQRITVSIGIAAFPTDASTAKELVRVAYDALAEAKVSGKNRVASSASRLPQAPSDRPKVLIVDDNEKNRKLLKANIEPFGYEPVSLGSADELFDYLNRGTADLILLDVMMPGIDGFQACRRLKLSEATRRIPIVLVTALDDSASKVRGIEAGADDFLTKPPDKHELLARIRSLIKFKQLDSNYTSLENVLLSLANAVEAKDSYTYGHTERVASIAVALGKRLNLPEDELRALRLGGILHDIGKIAVHESVLNKQGKLSDEEWRAVQAHADAGYRICLPLAQSIGKALDIIRHHHEKLDGSSYPDGLVGDQISVVARILTVADIYDALTSNRAYRKAMSVNDALRTLSVDASSGRIDPEVVSKLRGMVSEDNLDGRRFADEKVESGTKILVIDDDPLNLKLVKAILQGQDFYVITESDAEAGCATAKQEKPSLILMDIRLPGMSGIEATRMIREDPDLSDIPIIGMSAHALPGAVEEAIDAGCVHYITKPIDTRSFVATLDAYVLDELEAEE